jgi:hypothetical protein
MSELDELKELVALLQAEVLALRRQIGTTGMRLGPSQETPEDIERRTQQLVSTIRTASAVTDADRIRAIRIKAVAKEPYRVADIGEPVDLPMPPPPVDRSALCTTDGRSPEEARASQTNATGQHPSYLVLCDAERAKGFVRPYRDRYKHTTCGGVTTMGRSLSETYARDPGFYGATFCCTCNRHLPVSEFVWSADGQQVGS